MKQIIISLLMAFCVSSPSLGDDARKPLSADELAWFYTLAVQKESDHFSFSLMKEGWLAFDTWGDGKEMKEGRIEISEDQYAKLKMSFEDLFQDIQRTGKNRDIDEQPSYAFERVTDSVTTLEFAGHIPKVEEFLDELSKISKKPLPFSVKTAEPVGAGQRR